MKKSVSQRLFLSLTSVLVVAVLAVGCTIPLDLDGSDDEPEVVDDAPPVDITDPAYQAGLEIALQNLDQIVRFKWTPVGRIPKANQPGQYFEPGKTYSGLPYSSVKELDKFIGQDVSFYTFVSALNNPRSVLYTEVVNEPPYNGVNCAPYYGTVCSMSVNYALGIDVPYASVSLRTKSFMQKVSNDDIDALEPGDLLICSNHTVMVVGVVRESDKVTEVTVFENSYYLTRDREKMIQHWSDKRYAQYRYRRMPSVRLFEIVLPDNEKPSLCVNRGDKSVYRCDEPVVVNILDGSYKEIHLFREGTLVESRKYQNRDETFEGLSEGLYSVCLADGDRVSDVTLFEVLDVKIVAEKKGKHVLVDFSGNSVPATAVELCDIAGRHMYTAAISEEQNASPSLTLNAISSKGTYYCKLLFQGVYGKIPCKMVWVADN